MHIARGMKRSLAIALQLAVALPLAAHDARARPTARFFLDGAFGLTVPIADADYADEFYPSPAIGLRLGGEIWLRPRFGLAPEVALDGGPLVGQRSTGVTTGRFRFQPGLRVLFGFGRGHAFFLRFLVGGELFVYGPGGRGGAGTVNLGFAAEPGFGMQFRVARRAVAGFTAGFPVGAHTFGAPATFINADFALSGFVGLRL